MRPVFSDLVTPSCPTSSFTNNVVFSYSQPTPVGGISPYTYSTSGTLPSGISAIASTTGLLSGKPTSPGQSYSFTITVRDAAGVTLTSSSCAGTGKEAGGLRSIFCRSLAGR